MRRLLLVLLAFVTVAQQPAIDPAKVLDLTYPFDDKTIYWPTAKSFQWKKDTWGITPDGYFLAMGSYAASEHGGTHLDAPLHFSEHKWAVDEIPLNRLIAPARVIDISAQCAKDRDYRLAVADIEKHEHSRGRIPDGIVVLVRAGWGARWPDKKSYLGCDIPGDDTCLSFPGLSKEAASVLVQRHVAGVGIDTASMDYGRSKDFIVHQVLYGAGLYGLENVANLDKVPEVGATLISLPLKIRGGSGAPVRILAVLP